MDDKGDRFEQELMQTLGLFNLIIFGLLIGGALIFFSWQQALGVTVGGAIALINFGLLKRTVLRTIRPEVTNPLAKVLIKYYIRFVLTCLVLFALVRWEVVEPLGLLVGLSAVVLSVFAWFAHQTFKLNKEAV
jgi:hypothetical protein